MLSESFELLVNTFVCNINCYSLITTEFKYLMKTIFKRNSNIYFLHNVLVIYHHNNKESLVFLFTYYKIPHKVSYLLI